MSNERVGGCAEHNVRGPVRTGKDAFKQANKDAAAHDKRMHGGKNPSSYVGSKPEKR